MEAVDLRFSSQAYLSTLELNQIKTEDSRVLVSIKIQVSRPWVYMIFKRNCRQGDRISRISHLILLNLQ